ncbi:MAG: hypothetical protein JWN68_865 [Nocardioides sp.]|jgi:hypothetical protein|uniref:hypothetical protein n=1 Tax=Nocardioides sp. TaxID=35761 RepID=UPI0026249C6D|nr:hypothetical protein [Nocardioides sp.]MCW2832912.1 hypothetical protein [Nocardioides sp.]
MVLLSDVGGLTGVRNTLSSILVPAGVIEKIVKILQEESDSLSERSFPPVPAAAFGTRFSGENLGTHTDKAHARLNNAVLEAVASLQITTEAMDKFDRELEESDANSHAASTALLRSTERARDNMDDNRNTPPPQQPNGSDQ